MTESNEQQNNEPIEVYSDQYQIHLSPWGSLVDFGLAPPPTDELNDSSSRDKKRRLPAVNTIVRVRMSLEQTKLLAFMLQRLLKQYEEKEEVEIQLPRQLLNALGVSIDEWKEAWEKKS